VDDNSPFCRNISFPHKFCQFPAGAFQGASQTWAALTHDGALHTHCRETKCKAVGDPYCELTLVIIRKEIPIEFLQNHMPELFEDIDTGFVDY
jgi:predicted hydrocarbon binding protein